MPPLELGMVNMANPLRFGTLGVARITPGGLIGPAAENADAVVAAVAARDRSRAESFAKQHGIETVYDSYDDVIQDPTLDVIYNPLPISHHREYTIKALREFVWKRFSFAQSRSDGKRPPCHWTRRAAAFPSPDAGG